MHRLQYLLLLLCLRFSASCFKLGCCSALPCATLFIVLKASIRQFEEQNDDGEETFRPIKLLLHRVLIIKQLEKWGNCRFFFPLKKCKTFLIDWKIFSSVLTPHCPFDVLWRNSLMTPKVTGLTEMCNNHFERLVQFVW